VSANHRIALGLGMVASAHSIAGRSEDSSRVFKMPNPGDVFILTAFGWATLCFFLVTIGTRLFVTLAQVSGSVAVREMIRGDQSAVAVVMLIGIMAIALGYFLLVRYPYFLLGAMLFGPTFGAAEWDVVHDPAFALRYLCMVYLGVFGVFFLLQNVWRLLATPYYRLILLYLAWTALVVVINGFEFRDIWYLATEFTLMLAFGAGWLVRINSPDKFIDFNKFIAYIAIPVTLLHLISPLVIETAIAGGRFQSYFSRPTGFSIVYSLFAVALFWLSMHEKRKLIKLTATTFALIGLGLILVSGTRNATVATLIGVGVLWWVFRTRIFTYLIVLAMMGLLVQILLSGNQDLEFLYSRLQSTENTRLDIWALYGNLVADSPIFGYGYSGLSSAVYGDKVIEYASRRGFVNVPQVHNYYLGQAVRFGVPGLLIVLGILYVSFRTAWQVIFSAAVSVEDKKYYILPVALLAVIALEGLFEDHIGSTGKGSLHGVLFGSSAYLIVVYGRQLLSEAVGKVESVPSVAYGGGRF
jgi:O-antigen ligase